MYERFGKAYKRTKIKSKLPKRPIDNRSLFWYNCINKRFKLWEE